MVDLPTPPFADETAITLRTSRMLRLEGKPRWRRGISGGAPERGRSCDGAGLEGIHWEVLEAGGRGRY